MKKIYLWGITFSMFLCLTACVPWGKERYIQVSFIQAETDSHFEIELLLLTDYSGEKAPSSPTNTLSINLPKNFSIETKPPEIVKFELVDLNLKGVMEVGDTIEVDRTTITQDVINRIIEESKLLNLTIEYVEDENLIINENIRLKYNGAPAEYYRKKISSCLKCSP